MYLRLVASIVLLAVSAFLLATGMAPVARGCTGIGCFDVARIASGAGCFFLGTLSCALLVRERPDFDGAAIIVAAGRVCAVLLAGTIALLGFAATGLMAGGGLLPSDSWTRALIALAWVIAGAAAARATTSLWHPNQARAGDQDAEAPLRLDPYVAPVVGVSAGAGPSAPRRDAE
ncbi:MAG: hypothetical protein AAF675_13140 [Pseudomonadota bacterium]